MSETVYEAKLSQEDILRAYCLKDVEETIKLYTIADEINSSNEVFDSYEEVKS